MENKQHEVHPFAPVWDERCRILVLGSFPSVKSRQSGFYYGNPQNRFWQVLEAVFNDPVPLAIVDKRTYLLKHHMALWDALASCDIIGSSDSSIKNPIANNLDLILKTAPIEILLANGQLASKIIKTNHSQDIINIMKTLPSTSPANASWSLERLIEIWSQAMVL